MTVEEYKCEACNFGQDGAVCALHGVEVERRKTTSDLVIKLEQTTNALTKFMWTMVGVSLLGAMILAGSYIYTANVERNLGARQDVARGKIETLSSEVTKANTNLAVTEDRYLRIYQQLDKISEGLDELNKKYKHIEGLR